MKKLTLVLSLLMSLSACKEGGGSPSASAGNAVAPVESKSCESTLQRAWRNTEQNIIYEFHSTCKGYIPSCGVEFDYSIDEIDPSGGTISLVVTSATSSFTGCPLQGDQAVCTFDYHTVGGQRQGMYVRCSNGPTVYYENRYGTP